MKQAGALVVILLQMLMHSQMLRNFLLCGPLHVWLESLIIQEVIVLLKHG
jgi:hypothetical protein